MRSVGDDAEGYNDGDDGKDIMKGKEEGEKEGGGE